MTLSTSWLAFHYTPIADAMDQLEQRVGEFFSNAKKNKPEWRDEQMTAIKKVSCGFYAVEGRGLQ